MCLLALETGLAPVLRLVSAMAVLLAAAMVLHWVQADLDLDLVVTGLQPAHSDIVLLERRVARADDMRAYLSSSLSDEVQLHPNSFLPFAETVHPLPAVAVAVAHIGYRVDRILAASL